MLGANNGKILSWECVGLGRVALEWGGGANAETQKPTWAVWELRYFFLGAMHSFWEQHTTAQQDKLKFSTQANNNDFRYILHMKTDNLSCTLK